MSTTTAVIAQDFHFPYHDETCLKLFLKFIKETRPDQIIIPGDLVDFYSISKFSKDPSRMLEANLSKELALVARFWMALRNASKRSRIVYTPGNHEDRLQHYVWQNAPALAFLDELKLERLLKLKEYGVEYHKEYYWLGDLLVTHGSRISKHAGWSAKMEFEKNGCSGISGHSHRDSKYSVRNMLGQFVWFENGCCCDLKPEYIKGVANWSQGFSEVVLTGKSPRVTFIPIINGKLLYNGRELK